MIILCLFIFVITFLFLFAMILPSIIRKNARSNTKFNHVLRNLSSIDIK